MPLGRLLFHAVFAGAFIGRLPAVRVRRVTAKGAGDTMEPDATISG